MRWTSKSREVTLLFASDRFVRTMTVIDQITTVIEAETMPILHVVKSVTNGSWLHFPSQCPIQM
jgi:hypothetical protein